MFIETAIQWILRTADKLPICRFEKFTSVVLQRCLTTDVRLCYKQHNPTKSYLLKHATHKITTMYWRYHTSGRYRRGQGPWLPQKPTSQICRCKLQQSVEYISCIGLKCKILCANVQKATAFGEFVSQTAYRCTLLNKRRETAQNVKMLHRCSMDSIEKGLQPVNYLHGYSGSLPLLPFDRPYTISLPL